MDWVPHGPGQRADQRGVAAQSFPCGVAPWTTRSNRHWSLDATGAGVWASNCWVDNHGQPGLRLPERRVARHVPECPPVWRARHFVGTPGRGRRGHQGQLRSRQSPRDGCEPGASLRVCLGLASCCKGGKHDPLAVGCRSGRAWQRVATRGEQGLVPQRRGEDGAQKECGKPPMKEKPPSRAHARKRRQPLRHGNRRGRSDCLESSVWCNGRPLRGDVGQWLAKRPARLPSRQLLWCVRRRKAQGLRAGKGGRRGGGRGWRRPDRRPGELRVCARQRRRAPGRKSGIYQSLAINPYLSIIIDQSLSINH